MDDAGTTYPSGLVAADVIWKGELYPSGGGNEWTFTSANNWPNITTDASRYFLLTAAPTYSFKDSANKLTNALTYNSALGVSLSFSGNYTTLFNGGSQYFTIQNLQIKRSSGSGYTSNSNGTGRATFLNCIHYNSYTRFSVSATNCLFVSSTFEKINGSLLNCTCVGFSAGTLIPADNYTSVTLKNNAFFGYSVIISDATKVVSASSTYNATDLSSFGWSATGNIVSKTYANQFQNVTSGTEDFRVKAAADLINAGTRDQTNTNDLDIVGSARSTSTPTIGAWEYSVIVSAPSDTASFNRGVGRGIARGIA